MTPTPGTVEYAIRSEWNTGFVADVNWTPSAAVNHWRIELTFDGTLDNIWNAAIVSHVGDTYILENLPRNGVLGAGETVTFGFQATGAPADLSFAAAGDGTGDGGEPAAPPDVSVAAASTAEGNPDEAAAEASVMGPLSTSSNQIVNAAGEAVQIEAVNWFGLETGTIAPHGLWTRNWQEMMDEIKATGFNAIRLPFSLDAVLDPAAVPNGIDFGLNPDLAGLGGLDILDRIVGYAEDIGLGIILDNHRSAAGDGPNGNGLWYDGPYSQADWIGAWQTLAARYGDSPAIIGADLANEPHGATWDAWASAAEAAGNAILAETSDWLVIVEGVASHNGDNYWWGGNLQGVADRPVTLSASDKLVYSPHDYPASVYAQPWFTDGSNLFDVFRENWGFIHEEGIAPILVGEFGSRLETAADQAWADAIVAYLGGDFDGSGTADPGANAMNFAWWSWNPNSGDTGGILEDDWRTIRTEAVDLLAPLIGDGGSADPETIRFEITLSEAADTTTLVSFATEDGTATAGEDYVARDGTLSFAPGETQKFVDITVLPDTAREGDETFVLRTTGPAGTAAATGTIVDDDGPVAPPVVSLANVRVDEAVGRASITAVLSEASSERLFVDYETMDLTAVADEDYRAREGRFVFEAGETESTRYVRILDDGIVEDTEAFIIHLTAVSDVTLDRVRARVRINDNDADASALKMDASATDDFSGF
ncbi:cellulase family glycosylhydrolase [Acuticoccus sp. MNP-M23]|uniref:cellulase family glycosylhydrolase n=1 Tax=Acuticoccus sp. MNP-M23 TaxID=3072793 RepID=UPI002815C408|nr:cellulase family glycosylhydrolase [Acuticoccus sp. MNP-M23]WMS44684.1 cellulase family glycosylhydrolase [Acuticoccus sp. MNP-M23]